MQKKTTPKKAAKKKKVEVDVTSELLNKPEELKIREFPWTPKQVELIKLIMDKRTQILFLAGPAGSSKSLVSVYAGLKLLQEKRANDITYIRSVVESSTKSLGFLPGNVDDKISPFLAPLLEKLDELLPFSQVNELNEAGIVRGAPNSYLRGLQFRGFIIVDEAQNFDRAELTTIMTRLATGGKILFIGDFLQSGVKRSGFKEFFELFDNPESKEKGIHTFTFDKSDIRRSPILAFVCDKIETLK